MQDIILEKV